MNFFSASYIHNLSDALGVSFELQTHFSYAVAVLLITPESKRIHGFAIFDQPGETIIDGVNWCKLACTHRDQAVLISISNSDCDQLSDVDLGLFTWAKNELDLVQAELTDWIKVGDNQYRSMAVTCTPNRSWDLV